MNQRHGAVVVLVLAMLTVSGTATVMNANPDQLPPGCEQVSGEANITVHAGRDQAEMYPGTVFTYSNRSMQFEPCTRLTVTFVNHDQSRHQWMVHGLPEELHPNGMFLLEATGSADGPGRATGTIILPGTDETLLVHCGLPQHMQKGMKAQLVVGQGDGTISNIPGVSDAYDEYQYARESPVVPTVLLGTIGIVLGATVFLLVRGR